MPNYCVTVKHGVFEIEADDEDDAREQALDMVEMDIDEDECDDEEGDEEDDK